MPETVILPGCTPVPLSGYLKSLGVLRIVAEQLDRLATGHWERDMFVLNCSASKAELCSFLLNDYAPMPLVAPWNGGSGFFPKDNTTAIDAITEGTSERFADYRQLIEICRRVLRKMGQNEKPDSNIKPTLLQRCRNFFPDAALQWLDAAYVLTDDGPKYPPLLGTGGNDGRLEFTNNYMQRLVEIFDTNTGLPAVGTKELLEDSLFGKVGATRQKAAIGQFDPGSAGGANSSGGYDADPTMNVWDFILMLEGAITFAGASVRKLEHGSIGSLAYPFCVRPAGVGYGSADLSDEETSRSEMWMPLWNRPASFDAVTHLLSEGRVDIGHRRARNGVDFARAIASVGVDRGIESFQRFGFQQRNGLSFFAVPLGRFEVRSASSAASLLGRIDTWLDRFRRAATGQHAPARASSALRRLESAILDACQSNDKRSAQHLLVALGNAEMAVANSPKLREADYPLAPVPLLPPEWIEQCYDESLPNAREFRLAASLAGLGFSSGLRVDNEPRLDPVGPIRRHLEPIDPTRLTGKNRRSTWADQANDPALVWGGGDLVRNLNRVLNRRMIDAMRSSDHGLHAPFDGRCPARLSDVEAFIQGHTDDGRIMEFLFGLALIDWPKVSRRDIPWHCRAEHPIPSAAYCVMKLCLLPHPVPTGDGGEVEIKLSSQITRRASAGDLVEATRLASQRLKASGLQPAIDCVPKENHVAALRTAAALVFPLRHEPNRTGSAITMIRNRVMRRTTPDETFDERLEVSVHE